MELHEHHKIILIAFFAVLSAMLADYSAATYYGSYRAILADFDNYGLTLYQAQFVNFLFALCMGFLIFQLSGKSLLAAFIAIFGFSTMLIMQLNLYKEALALLIAFFALWKLEKWQLIPLPFILVSFWSSGVFLGMATAISKLYKNDLGRLPLKPIFMGCFGLAILVMLVVVPFHKERLYLTFYGLENLGGWLILFFLPLALLVNFSRNPSPVFLSLGIFTLLGACAYLLFFYRAEIDFWRIMVLFEYSAILAAFGKEGLNITNG